MHFMFELASLLCQVDIGSKCCCAFLGTLHLFWLPMPSKAHSKVLVFVFKSFNGLGLSLSPPSCPSSLVI